MWWFGARERLSGAAARSWGLRHTPVIAWTPDATDIFCGEGKRREGIRAQAVYTTPHFYVIANHKPIASGHLLIIPRWHIPMLGSLPPQWAAELEGVQQRVRDFYRSELGAETLFYENDLIWQTIHHAHLHAVPLPRGVTALPPLPGGVAAPRWPDVRVHFDRGRNHYQLLQVGSDRRLFAGGTDDARGANRWIAETFGVARDVNGRWMRNLDLADSSAIAERFRDWLRRNPVQSPMLAA
jgi:diadenosine tetraphosphate (Ap4A) HIT family hydrolase